MIRARHKILDDGAPHGGKARNAGFDVDVATIAFLTLKQNLEVAGSDNTHQGPRLSTRQRFEARMADIDRLHHESPIAELAGRLIEAFGPAHEILDRPRGKQVPLRLQNVDA